MIEYIGWTLGGTFVIIYKSFVSIKSFMSLVANHVLALGTMITKMIILMMVPCYFKGRQT